MSGFIEREENSGLLFSPEPPPAVVPGQRNPDSVLFDLASVEQSSRDAPRAGGDARSRPPRHGSGLIEVSTLVAANGGGLSGGPALLPAVVALDDAFSLVSRPAPSPTVAPAPPSRGLLYAIAGLLVVLVGLLAVVASGRV